MDTKKVFLSTIKTVTRTFAVGTFTMFCAVASVYAASDNGCSDEDNNFITPELALCSTHAYNIGWVTNPDNEANKQVMRDVVALKSTVMMQQMYKQYQYLESTLNRLKTQLEREILTTKLEAAGATPASSSTSSSAANASDMNIYLAGTTNCNNMATTAEVYTCLRNNYNLIYNMSNGGTNLTIELRRQLANDYNVMKQNAGGVSGMSVQAVTVNGDNLDCTAYNNLNNRDKFQACLNALNTGIRNATNLLQQQQQRTNTQQSR